MRRGIIALLLGLAVVVGFLGVRAYQDWQMLRQPAAVRMQDTSRIRGWMTVGFIANAHGVSAAALAEQLGAPPGSDLTLNQLARAQGVPPAQEQQRAREAVAALRAQATPAAVGAEPDGRPAQQSAAAERL